MSERHEAFTIVAFHLLPSLRDAKLIPNPKQQLGQLTVLAASAGEHVHGLYLLTGVGP